MPEMIEFDYLKSRYHENHCKEFLRDVAGFSHFYTVLGKPLYTCTKASKLCSISMVPKFLKQQAEDDNQSGNP